MLRYFRGREVMQALIVVDAQNEFSAKGQRPVPNFEPAVKQILARVAEARDARRPIAWVIHYNRPNESRAFVPGTWGAELASGLGPQSGFGVEKIFEKDVFGAFTYTGLEDWLRSQGVDSVLLTGFFTHMCVSTSAREALVRGFDVAIDPEATGAWELQDEELGGLSADEVRRTALLQLKNMGVTLAHGDAGVSSAAASKP